MAPGALTISQMSDPEIHTCSADKVAPLMQNFCLQLAKMMKEDLDVGWLKMEWWMYIGTLCNSPFKRYKWYFMWNMWKGIHSSFKPEQAHRHHRGEKPLIGPNLCQLWLQFDHNVSIEKARDGAHCIGPTQRPIRKTFFFLMLFPVYKR